MHSLQHNFSAHNSGDKRLLAGARWGRIVLPLLASGLVVPVWAVDTMASNSNPFELNAAELEPIRYTRSEHSPDVGQSVDHHQTEFSFKLKPGRPEFSRHGGYGIGMLGRPQFSIQGALSDLSLRGREAIPELLDGLEYSAGVRIEHEDADIDGTAYVSSSLLGLSYGRLGRLWYGGIDLNLERFSDEHYGEHQPDVLSLDFTTGRRLGFTGLATTSPLWMLSLQGNFDVWEGDIKNEYESSSDWYFNPSLFWQHPGFTFSAQMQVPVDMDRHSLSNNEQAPDYRLRAVFEKRFK
ncbi:MAG: hypothetical protein V3U76_11495 [Granulosicoccus sp.]